MPYITREDGVNFVIPSYRDVLIAKNKGALQKDMTALGQSYGEFATMQRKSPQQYEVAFSTDSGYLLGETVWHHFNRPVDMIYCEAVPNTSEAILVIVKGGSVYLDGSFPVESIPEELVIFLTQQNNFEIFIYGDVPISEKPTEGKFSFDEASIKSFKVLEQPVFASLPLLKSYQLQLIDALLKEHGIGVFPITKVVTVLGFIGAIVFLIMLVSNHETAEQEVKIEPNPYQEYVDAMVSPQPDQVMRLFIEKLELLYSVPGWSISTIKYSGGSVEALMRSEGRSIESLIQWCSEHDATTNVQPVGFIVSTSIKSGTRPKPREIFPAKDILAILLDRLDHVYPGNNVSLEMGQTKGSFSTYIISINISGRSPSGLALIGDQFKGLPLVLEGISLSPVGGLLQGRITLKAMGK